MSQSQTPTVQASTTADLFAIPAAMLGFQPQESVVVIGMDGSRAAFCARLDMFATVLDDTHRQLAAAFARLQDPSVVILGFSHDPGLAAGSAAHLAGCLDVDINIVMVTDGAKAWVCDPQGELSQEESLQGVATSPVAQAASQLGRPLAESRDALVAQLQPRADRDEVRSHLLPVVEPADEAAQHSRVEALLDSGDELTDAEAVELAHWLGHAQRRVQIYLASPEEAAARLPHVIAARLLAAPGQEEAHVVAAMAIFGWLAGQPVVANEGCIQLRALMPEHPMLSRLESFLADAVNPASLFED